MVLMHIMFKNHVVTVMAVGLWIYCLTVIENHYFKEIEFYFIKFLMCNKVYKGKTVNDTLYWYLN